MYKSPQGTIGASLVGKIFKKTNIDNSFLKNTWVLLCPGMKEIDRKLFKLFAKHCAVKQNLKEFNEITFQSQIPCLKFNDDTINTLNSPVTPVTPTQPNTSDYEAQEKALTSLPPHAYDYKGNIKPEFQHMINESFATLGNVSSNSTQRGNGMSQSYAPGSFSNSGNNMYGGMGTGGQPQV